jgi:hypothetical protein
MILLVAAAGGQSYSAGERHFGQAADTRFQ